MFRFWEDACIVFNPSSGDVHLLSSLHGKLLEICRSSTNAASVLKKCQLEQIHPEDAEDEGALLMWIDGCKQEFSRLNLL